MEKIIVKEVPIEEAVKVNATIAEFGEKYPKEYFENRYRNKKKLIIVAYIGKQPAGYVVGYDKYGNGSFYCWMAGVNPKFRRMGVLKVLINYQNRWAKKNGYRKIRVKTRNNRREMLAYLIRYGYYFTEVDRRENIEENRILLEKEL